jgi:polysaccharide export outer membrane protein
LSQTESNHIIALKKNNNYNRMKYFSLISKATPFFLIMLLFSCASRKDLVYYQGIDEIASQEKSRSYEIKIQPDDLLMIIVSAEDPEIAMPFNLNSISVQNPERLDVVTGQVTMQLYLVDANGFIEFPVLGKIKVSGLARSEVFQMLQQKIGVYIKNPMINLRIMNFKVSVQGEVTQPGTYNVASERITLIEALTMAKDLTIYGKRNNILIIREINGVKSYNRVDITNADFINSPFYYLAQNDVVYVEPNKNRINGAAIGSNTGVIISISSLLITLITLIITTTK